MSSPTRRPLGSRALALALSGTLAALALNLGGCVARPGPAPVVEDPPAAEAADHPEAADSPDGNRPGEAGADNADQGDPESTTTPGAQDASGQPVRSTINVGVDPLRAGLNPHLAADASALVDSLADLVLPSPFKNGQPDPNLVVSAREVAPPEGSTVQRSVRYVIAPEAQWSDGTPVSGNDFAYLWRMMVSTPGVVGAAGYRAISAVRVGGGGKTVDVDFAYPVAQWRELFAHLLPSHLVAGEDFASALHDTIPASAGRYMVWVVDRSRGIIELGRNDRFWGSAPAATEVLSLRPVRSAVEGSDQLRSGQLSFIDVTPAQTTQESFGLVPGTQTRQLTTDRRLEVRASAISPRLRDAQVRATFLSLIDAPRVARLATGRTAPLEVPSPAAAVAGVTPGPEDVAALREASHKRALRIAADPADPTASAAARTIVDLLAHQGVSARVVATDIDTLAATQLPEGTVDAVVVWSAGRATAMDVADAYSCGVDKQPGNLSGYCDVALQPQLVAALGGKDDAAQLAQRIESSAHLSLPLLKETRLLVTGQDLEGPDPNLENWTAGLSAAATWKKK